MRYASPRPFTFVALAFVATTYGCNDIQTTEFARAESPDHLWIVKAIDERHFGPGAAGDLLRVTLQRQGGNGAPGDILVLSPPDDQPYQGHPSSYIQIKWLNPSHLELSYRAATIDLQVVKYAGLQISTVELPRRA